MNLKSVTGKSWLFKKYNERLAQKIFEKFSLNQAPEVSYLSKFLAIRKVEIDKVNNFLNPTLKDNLPNPIIIKDMSLAIDIIVSHIKKKNVIGIFGDYDVDGAASTALLGKFFSSINHPYEIFIPDRIKNGYGPSVDGFNFLIKKKSKIIITVDCGTSSYVAISHANKLNIKTIVLDHHQANIKLPNAVAIVNPNRMDDRSNLNYLCATGVCFLFLIALSSKLKKDKWFILKKIKEPNLLDYLDLVCLGTVCDVVPVIGLNRVFIKQGLKIIKKRKNVGLKTLFDNNKIMDTPNSHHIGYLIGPMINAGGRVGKSSYGSQLLISNDPKKVSYISRELEFFNNKRKIIEFDNFKRIENKIKNFKDPIILVDGNDFHEGVMGIVASKLREKFNKPCIIISNVGNIGRGSARSIPGFDIGRVVIVAIQNKILIAGGGHKMAAGFSIDIRNITKFKEFVIKEFNKFFIDKNTSNNIYLDSLILPSALNEDFYSNIEKLSPFGSGNSEPKFLIENLKLINSKVISKKHIKAIFTSNNNDVVKSIAFDSVGTILENYLMKNNNNSLNLVGSLISNNWNGKKNIEFVINDISVNNI